MAEPPVADARSRPYDPADINATLKVSPCGAAAPPPADLCGPRPRGVPAWADDRSDCNGDKTDAAIAACTRVIRSGKSTGQDLAMVYYARGRSYRLMGDNDRAIADYNESIKLNSSYAPAFLGRGNAWKSKRDLDRAIADFSQAIRLDPKFTSAFFNRADAYDDKGDTPAP